MHNNSEVTEQPWKISASFVHESRMIRMIGLIILVAQIIILMTRMIAQICKNTRESTVRAPEGRGRRPRLVFLAFPNFLFIFVLSS